MKKDQFETYEIEAFKIDSRPTYNVTDEQAVISQWKSGVPADEIQMHPSHLEWRKGIAERIKAGARHIRVKVISDKGLSEYNRFGYDIAYVPQAKLGAKTFFILRSDFDAHVAGLGFDGWEPNDFWLFDLETGIEQFYNDDYSYRDATDMDAATVAKYLALRNAVLESDKLFDLAEFEQRYVK